MKNFISEILLAIPVIVFLISIAAFVLSAFSYLFYRNLGAQPIVMVSGVIVVIGVFGLVVSSRFRKLVAENFLSAIFTSWW